MPFQTSHVVRFEADGQLLSEQHIEIPREQWPHHQALDAAFIEQLTDEYFRAMQRMTLGVFYTVPRGQGRVMRAPVFGDVLVFDHKQVTVEADRARLTWSVVGGTMRSRRGLHSTSTKSEKITENGIRKKQSCLLYTSPSPRD